MKNSTRKDSRQKTNRYGKVQIIDILKETESGQPVKKLCRNHGIRDVTIDNRKSKYEGLTVSDAHRLKALEEESLRLKLLVRD